jgi:hypothetical protein
MQQHFRNLHPLDLVCIPQEGCYGRCHWCAMQVNPFYPCHVQTKECQVGVEHRKQRETAISSALALRQQFTVRRDVLKWVEVFKYLGRMMAQDDDDIHAVWSQMRKARATWARVGQILCTRTSRLLWLRGSIKLSSKLSSCTAARHGSSLETPSCGSRDFTFKLHTGWQRNTSRSADQVMYGSIPSRRCVTSR